MANLIIEKSSTIKWYSDLFPFFSLIESTVREHRWLWTDVVINAALPVPGNDIGIYLVDGDTIFDFAMRRPQFIWSVLSALAVDVVIDPARLETVPCADGNPNFWHGSPQPQFSAARF